MTFEGTTLDLSGKVAVVTGASLGIGRAIAERFARAGARVMLSARKQGQLDEAAAGIDGEVATFAANAGSPEQAQACVAATIAQLGGLDILVNNAATNPYAGPMIDIDLPRYDKTFQVNVRGPLVWTQEAWRQRLREHGGSVLNIASIGGLTFGGDIGVYDMSKAALIFQTRHLAVELAPNVRVNAIAPGLVKTRFATYLWQGAGPDADYPWPLKRIGQPDDIASAALWLSSDLASWVTGEVLVVDGGALVRGAFGHDVTSVQEGTA